jgi:hypothetical protein
MPQCMTRVRVKKKVCLRLVLRRAALLDTRYAECWLSEQERLDVIDQATEFETINIYFSWNAGLLSFLHNQRVE